MNTKTLVIAIISFLVGASLNSAGLLPFHWGIPFIPGWDNLLTIILIIGLFMLYSKINDVEERLDRYTRHRHS